MTLMPLLGRYRLYKSGTKRLIDWLTNSASHCCDLKSIIKSLDTNFKTKISKTKGAETPLEIRTQELLKLAEAIAKSQPLVDIPDTITQIAKDVIAGREECAEWYSAQALGGDVERENESHRYFIMVLQKILKLLSEARATRPKSETEPKARKSKAKREARPPVQDDELSNLFDCLDIEEPSDSPLGDQVVSAVIRMPNTTKVVHFKLEKEDADTAFATWCFLQDLNDVHGFVREIWLEYSRGVISFLVASSVTDTAFGLMRCADEEFGRFSGETTAWYPLVTRLGLAAFNRGFAVWMCPIIPGSKPRVTDSSINVVELLCPIAGMKPKPAGFHQYDDFCRVLHDLTPELHKIAHTRPGEETALDVFIQGLVQIHRNDTVPTWMVVACQVYLDVYDVLGPYIVHGAHVLEETFRKHRQVAADVEDYRARRLDGMADVGHTVDELDFVAKAANRFEELDWTMPNGKSPDKLLKELQSQKKPGCTASLLERSLPAHAGAVLMDLKLGMHNIGCQMANHRLAVLSMAHLYKALRGRGLLTSDWHDMDFVLAAFGGKQPLVAKTGQRIDPEAMARHYLLALGAPATDFAAGGRSNQSAQHSGKGARKLAVTSPLLQGLCSRRTSSEGTGLYKSKHTTFETVLHSLTANADRPEDNKQLVRQSSHLRDNFTPIQLLATYQKALLVNEPQLYFDYINFTLDCVRLLRCIAAEAGPKLGYEDGDEAGWHFALVRDLLRAPFSHPALTSTAKIMTTHVTDTGKKFVKQAYDQSSGRIPKHLRPKVEKELADREDSNLGVRLVLDYANTKYSFSGQAIAAYHPGIKSECCNGEGGYHHGETDPFHDHHRDHSVPPVSVFGSIIPSAIISECLATVNEDPEKIRQLRALAAMYLLQDQASCGCKGGHEGGHVHEMNGLQPGTLESALGDAGP